MKDGRSRKPLEPLNASITPWNFNVDLKIDKTIDLTNNIRLTLYARILNLFNRRNILNVYQINGRAENDGVINSDYYSKAFRKNLGEKFTELYNAINIENGQAYWDFLGRQLYGHPRQILLGVKVSY